MITTVADFRAYGPGAAFVDLSDAQIEWYLSASESVALSYIAKRGYSTDIAAADKDLKTAIFKVAAWDLVSNVRGVNPSDPGHAGMKMQRDEAIAWIRDVARGLANLSGADAPTRSITGTAAVFATSTDDEEGRGW